jgi:hypothetical protein
LPIGNYTLVGGRTVSVDVIPRRSSSGHEPSPG